MVGLLSSTSHGYDESTVGSFMSGLMLVMVLSGCKDDEARVVPPGSTVDTDVPDPPDPPSEDCVGVDSDGDGVCDDQEACPGSSDLLDRDGDGVPDGCDTCSDACDDCGAAIPAATTVVSRADLGRVVATDVDLDGDVDLLASENGGTVGYRNNGGGAFGVGLSISAASLLAVADLDQDGDPDVISSLDGTIVWTENLGAGAFGSDTTVIEFGADTPLDAVGSDLDGDGDFDLVISTWKEIVWCENLGGSFAPFREISLVGSFVIEVADLNGDGVGDLLTPSSWRAGSGGGTFGPATPLAGLVPDGVVDIAVGDFDADGDPDIAGLIPWSVELYENLGGGQFATGALVEPPSGEYWGERRSLVVGDLDGDGDDDLLSGGAPSGLVVHESAGNGVFVSIRVDPSGADLVTVAIADLDGDGDLDPVVGEGGGTSDGYPVEDPGIRWYANRGVPSGDADFDGTCDPVDGCADGDDGLDTDGDGVPNACDDCSSTTDGDGDDVVDDCDRCPGSDDGADGDGDTIPDACDRCPLDAPDDADGDGSCTVVDPCFGDDRAGDSDGDGVCDDVDPCRGAGDDADGDGVCADLDACEGHPDTLDSDGDGAPDDCDACPAAFTDDTDGDGVCDDLDRCVAFDDAVDGDGDGVPDLCDDCPTVADPSQGSVYGPARFVARTNEPRSPLTADLDGDGDLDLAWTSLHAVGWNENLGGGVFGPPLVVDAVDPGPLRLLDAGDADGDGDNDLLFGSWAEVAIGWYENQGGGFVRREIDGGSPVTVARFVDLDADGDDDVVAIEDNLTSIRRYESLGAAGFGLPVDVGAEGYALAFGDLDGDGDPDLLAAEYTSDTVAWYENVAGGFGGRQVVSAAATGVLDVAVGDVDRDGDVDVVWAGATVGVFENDGGVFVAGADIGQGAFAAFVRVEDLDRDGDADVLSDSSGNGLRWHEGLGDGGFADPVAVEAYDNSSGWVPWELGDLDGDGNVDLVSTSLLEDEVRWYTNVQPVETCP